MSEKKHSDGDRASNELFSFEDKKANSSEQTADAAVPGVATEEELFLQNIFLEKSTELDDGLVDADEALLTPAIQEQVDTDSPRTDTSEHDVRAHTARAPASVGAGDEEGLSSAAAAMRTHHAVDPVFSQTQSATEASTASFSQPADLKEDAGESLASARTGSADDLRAAESGQNQPAFSGNSAAQASESEGVADTGSNTDADAGTSAGSEPTASNGEAELEPKAAGDSAKTPVSVPNNQPVDPAANEGAPVEAESVGSNTGSSAGTPVDSVADWSLFGSAEQAINANGDENGGGGAGEGTDAGTGGGAAEEGGASGGGQEASGGEGG
ncbi:hypothetical protein, partial [Pseudohalioglobus lutimaris]